MRKRIFILCLILFGVQSITLHAQTAKKILVVYFSYSGNTKGIAEQIQKATNADIFRIVPQKDYPSGYNDVVGHAKKEINAGFKPPLKSKLANIEQYDIIFVGSPNWWTTIAPPVATFLSSYNFDGKTIIPLVTHEGSRLGIALDDMKKLCPKSNFKQGLSIRGSSVNSANDDVIAWLKELKIIK